jgi:hypothetical protein
MCLPALDTAAAIRDFLKGVMKESEARYQRRHADARPPPVVADISHRSRKGQRERTANVLVELGAALANGRTEVFVLEDVTDGEPLKSITDLSGVLIGVLKADESTEADERTRLRPHAYTSSSCSSAPPSTPPNSRCCPAACASVPASASGASPPLASSRSTAAPACSRNTCSTRSCAAATGASMAAGRAHRRTLAAGLRSARAARRVPPRRTAP